MKLSRKKYEANVPSMAMGDIAFLLLIFFVILARVQDDSHIQWEPARIAELDQAKNSKASVAIDADNKTYLNGREIGVANLAASLSEILGDAEAGHRMVLLKVHKDATATYFEPVIEAISEAGGDLLQEVHEVMRARGLAPLLCQAHVRLHSALTLKRMFLSRCHQVLVSATIVCVYALTLCIGLGATGRSRRHSS